MHKSFSEMLREKVPYEQVLKVFMKRLIAGDARIMEMWLNRIEGKVPDTVVQINAMFKESDEMNQKAIAWLRKYHPKLLGEFLKVMGIDER
jgi:hypothetical protein